MTKRERMKKVKQATKELGTMAERMEALASDLGNLSAETDEAICNLQETFGEGHPNLPDMEREREALDGLADDVCIMADDLGGAIKATLEEIN